MSQQAGLPPRRKHQYFVVVTDAPTASTSGVGDYAVTPAFKQVESEQHEESPEVAMEVATLAARPEFPAGAALSATYTLGDNVCRKCEGRGYDRHGSEVLSGRDPWTGNPRCGD